MRSASVWCPWLLLASALGFAGGDPARGESVTLPYGGVIVGTGPTPPDHGLVRVACDAFAEPMEFVSAAVDRGGDAAAADAALPGLPSRVGMLTVGGSRMLGCLAACSAGGVGWQPLGCSRPARFAAGVSGTIEYRGLDAVGGPGVVLVRRSAAAEWEVGDVPADGPAARDGRLRAGDRVSTCAEGAAGRPIALGAARAEMVKLLLVGPAGSVIRLGVIRENRVEELSLVRDRAGLEDLAGAAARDVLDRAATIRLTLGGTGSGGPATVHLRTGESLACDVLGADERLVRIRLADRGDVAIPIGEVRAIELLSSAGVRPILRQKLSRLLTVPRTQAGSPPTHILRMAGGDYLRGRLLAIDVETVRFDVAGETKRLARRDVVRIIRPATPDETQARLLDVLIARGGLPLVIVGGDGRRQALAATGMREAALIGEGPALGPTEVSLEPAARVLIGAAITTVSGADLPYAQWVLTPAVPPRAADRATP
ncbi:MAG: hypothetical protein ACKO6E_11710 [Planctomycetota bacterium]